MQSQTKFHLFKVVVETRDPDDTLQFKTILENHPDSPQILARNGNQFKLEGSVSKKGGLYRGLFCLIQKNDLPPKAAFGEDPEDIFEDDESGLGHYTAFIYDPSNDVICIQSNRNGVSAIGVANYFRRNSETKDIKFDVIINPDDVHNVANMKRITKLVFSVATPYGFINQAEGPEPVNDIIDFAKKTNARTIKVEIGMGYEREATLSRGVISKFIKQLFRKEESIELRKIEVSGTETDEGKIDTLDLITNRAQIEIRYSTPKSLTPVVLEGVINHAQAEYLSRKQEINQVYKVKSSN